jgi:hypothetical protein
MSIHLQQVPQADMLECRLEIPQIVPHPNNLHIGICSPNERGHYNNVLANDTYLVVVVKRLYYMIFGWWIFWANLHKESCILYFPNQNIFNHLKNFIKKAHG